MKASDRLLSDEELAAFWQTAESLGWPFNSIFKLLLLTGQRREELAGLLRREFDLDAWLWTIAREEAKNGKAHVVQRSLPARTATDCPFLFSNMGAKRAKRLFESQGAARSTHAGDTWQEV